MTTTSNRFRDFDWPMLLTASLLMCFGVVAIWSARGGGSLSLGNEGIRQALFGALGLCLMMLVASIDYRFLGTLAWVIYGLAVAALLAVLVPGIGVSIAGSRRWFDLGPITVQPSEFAKMATIIALGAFMASRGPEMKSFGSFLLSLVIAGVPLILVFVEPDLGTSTVFAVIWLSMAIAARVRWRYLIGLFALFIPVAIVGWEKFLQPYQRERLLISFDPYKDPTGAGYNILQSRYTIGSGGWFGAGLQGGTQSRLELLKVRESDFIFAHASGMFGFVGMCALMACYLLLLWRCMRVSEAAKDEFGQLIAIGFATTLFYQAFVNIGMNLGIMPVTGITLPLVSQGSSSLWTFLIGIGVMQSVLIHHRKLGFQPA